MFNSKKKVVLAYSGGLDTTCCIHWLKEQGFEVICFSANLGSEFSPQDLRRRSLKSGATKIYIKDLRREFAYGYILAALKANALYEGKYVLSTALGRPLIAKYLVEVARKERAAFVAHGCTAKGNDQLRFELSLQLLAPKLRVIAPLREWDLSCREEEIEYAKKNKLPIKTTKEKLYSIDRNLWGVSIEGGPLEDLKKEPPLNSYYFIKRAEEAEKAPLEIEIAFKEGTPLALNGKSLDLVALIERLNLLGAKSGIGRTDLIEDRMVGIKSREIYEAPAAWILITSHKELESLTLDRETIYFKELVALKYSQLIYQGLWFSHLKGSLDAFINTLQKRVSGRIGLKLYKGNIFITKRESPFALYKKELSTYGRGDKFDRRLAEGFIKLFGMSFKT